MTPDFEVGQNNRRLDEIEDALLLGLIGIVSKSLSVPAAKTARAIIADIRSARAATLAQAKLTMLVDSGNWLELAKFVGEVGTSEDDVYTIFGRALTGEEEAARDR